MAPFQQGKLVVLSGPSGAGKTTVLRKLLERYPNRLRLSVSATTRPPRPGEQDGKDYYFLSQEEFDQRRERGEFIECFEVFGRGYWYGTLREEATPSLEAGQWVILEVDVNGARAVLEQYPHAITIFLHSGSLGELERRLRERGTESEETIRSRLEVASSELAQAGFYRYQVMNTSVDETVAQISSILEHESLKNSQGGEAEDD